MSTGVYAGESDGKRVARVLMANLAVHAMMATDCPPGQVLTLAGREAAEAGIFKHLFCQDPADAIFVDTDGKGLDAATARWPGVRTYHGDVLSAIRQAKGRFRFVHLDFMGHITPHVESCFRALRRRMLPGGVLAFTFLRGREGAWTPNWKRAVEIVEASRKSICGGMSMRETANVRSTGYALLLLEILNCAWFSFRPGDDFVLVRDDPSRRDWWAWVGCFTYSSAHSPMGVLVFSYLEDAAVATEKLRQLESQVNELMKNGWGLGIPRHALPDLRRLVFDMADAGHPSERIAEIVNKPTGTIRAWLAHRTMGSYAVDVSR